MLALCNLSTLSSGSRLCSLLCPQLLSDPLCLSLAMLILCLLMSYPHLSSSHNSSTLPLELLGIPLIGSIISIIIFERGSCSDGEFLDSLCLIVSGHSNG